MNMSKCKYPLYPFRVIFLFVLMQATPLLGSPYDSVGNYDVVSYYLIQSDQDPKKGSKNFTFTWMKKTWYFSSARNRDLFAKDPQKYAPSYEGFCAYAVGNNYTYRADPLAWTIKDKRLFLNYSPDVREDWLEKASHYIRQGDKNWPLLKDK